ncbi:MAG: ribosome rescue GTPase HflX [Aromatoleum sp.]|jgi:GTP-binding protein HflX|uniref:ribosome rescue GTPase HflX n=1 Tax=Aromatoleum sp. TaxID=2307007 RepID=UPI002895E026|nr:ribosome rescue GTPase HflX [Aromatoleum sp.]MDT3670805.1 ribosome rescue GTPase HflX [Aromatoleum sp.]
MFERPESGERAVLVQLDLNQGALDERLSELKLLAASAGANVEAVVGGRRAKPDPALFAGSGKVEEIASALRAHDADIVIFNHALSPAQQRNLERALECRVIDRTALILDIFAQRARSHEGKLQVELAQLDHLSTRLVRGWTHLERQKGGIGLRGPGETQLETDRRLLGKRVKVLKERLARIEKQRRVRRRGRAGRDVLSVSLVGYTNAGKSTLFNAMTKAGAYAADQLFATLDTTSRRLYVGEAGNVVLSDTVGFIRDLPHALVAAFHSTLEETASADLLLHVVDAASEDREAQVDAVNRVLAEIGAGDVPQIMVMNKIDLTQAAPAVIRDEYGKIVRVFLSARTGDGLELLRGALAETAREAAVADDSSRSPPQSTDINPIQS